MSCSPYPWLAAMLVLCGSSCSSDEGRCEPGETDCGDGCVNLGSSSEHCGGCGLTCSTLNATGVACVDGSCVGGCVDGFGDCNADMLVDGCETNLATSGAHCGACGQACGEGLLCESSACVADCSEDLIACGTSCVNTEADPDHCLECDRACSTDNMETRTCTAGVCGGACAARFADCNGDKLTDGCETDIAGDADNCGDCGAVCSGDNVETRTCTDGVCDGTCDEGFADCNDDKLADGCETDIAGDPDSCGSCEGVCSANNMATRTCSGGVCDGACAAGFADCAGGKLVDGCETDIAGDPDSCGGCDQACSASNMAARACSAGQCDGACAEGFEDCNDDKRIDGCETDIAGDPDRCGGCDQACSANNMATRTCSGGVCDGACAEGFGDCNDDKLADGCETDIEQDPDHCGACGDACSSVGMATRTCSAGECDGACAEDFDDCNGDRRDGCEAHLPSSPEHCGACGDDCPTADHMVASCDDGECGLACEEGFTDCNDSIADGCEIATGTDPLNCGGCGTTCGADEVCVASACSKLVFTTSAIYGGDLGGVEGANLKRQTQADAAGLSGEFRAWISTEESPVTARLNTSWTGPYVRVNGVVVAQGFSGLISGTLRAPMNKTELGGEPALLFGSLPFVWTGTGPTGVGSGVNCSDWTDATDSSSALLGRWDVTTQAWTFHANQVCGHPVVSLAKPIYCIQQ